MDAAVLLQIIELGISEIVPIEQLVARLINVFKLNPNAQVNIQNLSADAIQADDDTTKLVNDWRKAKGLPPLPAST